MDNPVHTGSMATPDATPAGWRYRLPLRRAGALALLFYPGGAVRLRHRCARPARGTILCAPLLQLDGGGHTITTRTPRRGHHHAVTVQPSIACPDCGLHGWVHAGRWVPA